MQVALWAVFTLKVIVLPCDPDKGKWRRMDEWLDGTVLYFLYTDFVFFVHFKHT